jgi:hypothetical protein
MVPDALLVESEILRERRISSAPRLDRRAITRVISAGVLSRRNRILPRGWFSPGVTRRTLSVQLSDSMTRAALDATAITLIRNSFEN